MTKRPTVGHGQPASVKQEASALWCRSETCPRLTNQVSQPLP